MILGKLYYGWTEGTLPFRRLSQEVDSPQLRLLAAVRLRAFPFRSALGLLTSSVTLRISPIFLFALCPHVLRNTTREQRAGKACCAGRAVPPEE